MKLNVLVIDSFLAQYL